MNWIARVKSCNLGVGLAARGAVKWCSFCEERVVVLLVVQLPVKLMHIPRCVVKRVSNAPVGCSAQPVGWLKTPRSWVFFCNQDQTKGEEDKVIVFVGYDTTAEKPFVLVRMKYMCVPGEAVCAAVVVPGRIITAGIMISSMMCIVVVVVGSYVH